MPETEQQCFEQATFQRFLDEQVDGHEEQQILEHIETCHACQAKLAKLAGHESIWSEIKEHLTSNRLDDATAETIDVGLADQASDVQSIQNLLAPTDDPTKLGRLGPYEVCGVIGRGSTGVVVKALDTRLNRFVAIKILAPVYSNNGSARRRFEREGRSIASVKDAHVIPIYTVDEFQGLPYIVMQYVPDGSLLQRIEKHGPLDTQQVANVALQIAQGLAAAHERGIVHRDVKPANVLLESGVDRAMVTDFGLARVVDEATMTRSGAISGTPQYMSPEQAKGESVDQRSDLFSLGSVMYAACTGRSPFRAETVFGVIKRVCESTPRPIRETNPQIAPWLAAMIEKLHQKNPADRFESSRQIAQLLEKELAHMQSPTLIPEPERNWMSAPVSPVKPVKPVLPLVGGRRKRSRLQSFIRGTITMVVALGLGFAGFSLIGGEGGLVQSPLLMWLDNDPYEDFEQTLEKTIDVQPGGQLLIDANLGDVSILTHSKPEVTMTLVHRVRAQDQEHAEKLFKALDVTYEADTQQAEEWSFKPGADAVIIAEFGDTELAQRPRDGVLDAAKAWLQNDSVNQNARFEIRIPQRYNLNVVTGVGGIEAKSIEGWAKLKSMAGPIQLNDVSQWVDLHANGGRIEAGAIGEDCRCESMGGSVTLNRVGGDLVAKSAGGHIEVEQIKGEVNADTRGGHIRIVRADANVVAKTAGGSISIKEAGGAVDATTSAGNLHVNFTRQPTAESKLITRAGNILVGIPRSANLTVDAQCSLGDVSGPFIDGRKRKVEETLNDGGTKLTANVSAGSARFFYIEDGDPRDREHWEQIETSQLRERGADAFQRAYETHQKGDLQKAIELHQIAATYDNYRGIATYNLGCAYALLGETEKAFDTLERAADYGFDDVEQYETDDDLKSLREDARFKDLIDRLNGKEDPKAKIRRVLSRANQLLNEEEYDRLADACEAVLELDPEQPRAIFLMGYALHMSDRTDEAIEWHQRAAKTESYRGVANYNLGCAYAIEGKPERALERLEMAIDNGFDDRAQFENDEDLESLRSSEKFQALLDRLKAPAPCGEDQG